MLAALPPELLYLILDFLDFYDALALLSTHYNLTPTIDAYVRSNYSFHSTVYTQLLEFEKLCIDRNSDQIDTIAYNLLQAICDIVEPLPKYEHRTIFSEKLDILQELVVHRVLHIQNCEDDYASLCLKVRQIYLHTPSIRILHDPKYRRRSTKHPLAPFLPRDYTWIWRLHCEESRNLWDSKKCHMGLGLYPSHDTKLLQDRQKRLRFARFFGHLFAVSSIYLEAHQNGTLDECIREALVAGDVESLYILATAAHRDVDAEEMVMMIVQAGEQLWATLEMAAELEEQYRPDLVESRRNSNAGRTYSAPDWLLPTRYIVDDDTILRLKASLTMEHAVQPHTFLANNKPSIQIMRGLYDRGWDWLSLNALPQLE